MRTGDLVEVRTPTEILATLDENGCLDGLPFMPEMLDHVGGQFRVAVRVDRACDTLEYNGVRRINDAVILQDLRCSGTGHGGCQAQCVVYWKTAWLRPASAARSASEQDTASTELLRLANGYASGSQPGSSELRYRCQATDFLTESEHVAWWSPASLLNEFTSGNVRAARFVRVLLRMVVYETLRRFGIIRTSPFKRAGVQPETVPSSGPLSVGDLVRVRSRAEIEKTIDAKGGNRGLWFDREQLPYCGKTARVSAKVTRFVDERTGRLIKLSSDCYILDGVVCSGDRSICRWFCPRAINAWWREAWLEKVEDGAGHAGDVAVTGAGSTAQGTEAV